MNSILFPVPKPATYTAESLGEHLVYIPLGKSKTIPCLYVPHKKSSSYLIYSHANACDLGHLEYVLAYLAEQHNVNVLAYEYPGYGIAAGTPSPEGVKRNVMGVLRFVMDTLAVPTRNIILYGCSIGTGPTCYAADYLSALDVRQPCVILESPFQSIRDVAYDMVGSSASLAPNVFDNEAHVRTLTCPILFAHGLDDRVISAEHSKALYKAATRSAHRMLELIPNVGHNTIDEERHLQTPITRFLKLCHKPVRCDHNIGISDMYKVPPAPRTRGSGCLLL